MGTRLCGICFKSLWFFAGCRCALNRNSLIFCVIFTFSSVQPIPKRNFQMCSVQSFVLIIVNYFTVIKFTLIGYYRMRYVFTKLPKNSFLSISLKWDNIIKFCSVQNVPLSKAKHMIFSFLWFNEIPETRYEKTKNWLNRNIR